MGLWREAFEYDSSAESADQARTPGHLGPDALIDALADAARFWAPPKGDTL